MSSISSSCGGGGERAPAQPARSRATRLILQVLVSLHILNLLRLLFFILLLAVLVRLLVRLRVCVQYLGILLGGEVVDFVVRARLEARQQLALYARLQPRRNLRLHLAPRLALLQLCGHGDELGADLLGHLAAADEVLRNLGQPLLVLVHQELWPEREVSVDLLQRRCIRLTQLHLLPQLARRVRPLNRLHHQVAHACARARAREVSGRRRARRRLRERTLLLHNCSIAAVGKRARAAVAQARYVVRVAAKVLLLSLALEGAVAVVDDLRPRQAERKRRRRARAVRACHTISSLINVAVSCRTERKWVQAPRRLGLDKRDRRTELKEAPSRQTERRPGERGAEGGRPRPERR